MSARCRDPTGPHGAPVADEKRARGAPRSPETQIDEAILPPANLDLSTMLRPFADKLRMPHVKFAGVGGAPLEQGVPARIEEVVAMITEELEPRSVVLHLEELDEVPSPWSTS